MSKSVAEQVSIVPQILQAKKENIDDFDDNESDAAEEA